MGDEWNLRHRPRHTDDHRSVEFECAERLGGECIQWGALADSIGNTAGSWFGAYADPGLNDGLIDTSISFKATTAGKLFLGVWDTGTGDNNRNGFTDTTRTVQVEATPQIVPEPNARALFLVGLVGLGRTRRR